MAKCNSAIGSFFFFFFFEASVGSFLSHRGFPDLLDSDLHRTYIQDILGGVDMYVNLHLLSS